MNKTNYYTLRDRESGLIPRLLVCFHTSHVFEFLVIIFQLLYSAV